MLGVRLDVSGFELVFVINLNGLIQINYHSSSYKDPKTCCRAAGFSFYI